ncbi:MAG TPA: hypothetical protein VKA30_07025 [Actinomycetota bacterium]|nr:hypothetical protein [Actinomycetota bacterium]
MRFHPPFDRGIDAHWSQPWWQGFLGWFIPMLIVALLIGLAVWAVLRMTSPGRLAMAGGPGFLPARRADGALELVRTRYAKGEITRDEFAQLSNDLGEPLPVPPPEPPPGEPAR